ncbi:piggyBac transposable element-derived protein 3-like isoform X2 [Gymnodraco acuticeps]|uniref:PiggyBac transposable element-derived protein 3-like isoform X2 n=1 Tax=Gymnodraco acuticeps TaxID=8218 RepID=A0A6P8VW82_GYMAC|nr:piggyBac transposable element-derived protein 3-like isoform X2 [Gymnodraco acuticeps]
MNLDPRTQKTLRYVPAARSLILGPTHYAVARISDPASSFALLLTDDILQHIVSMTNLHGRRSIAEWRDMDTEELQAYVGLLILVGVYRSKNESTLSLWSEKLGRSIFRATMSHKRFHQISRTLRFDDKLSRPRRRDDKLAAFRKVLDMWTHRLPMLFSPFSDVCVDEQLVPFRGRCSFKQYMPKKPAKYGIKIWANCDVKSSSAWRLQVYTGQAAGSGPEVNQGMRVVLEMTEGLQGHIITCDNVFTSFALAEELLRRKLALVGTIRPNKPELPPILLQARARAILSSTFAFPKTHTLVSYIPRRGRNVLLLSTKHRSPDVSDEMKRKPVIIKDYNRCKGGVDNLDKVVATGGEQIAGHLPSSTTWLTFLITTPTSCGHQWSHPGSSRNHTGGKRWEKCWRPHTSRREGCSSAAATMVSDLQGAAAGPSLISERKS